MGIAGLVNNWFDIAFFGIFNGSLAWLELYFFGTVAGRTIKWYHFFSYIALVYFICGVEILFRVLFPVATLLELMTLFLFLCFVFKTAPALSAITAILAISIMQVVNGIFRSLFSLLCMRFFSYAPFLSLAGSIVSMVAIFYSYRYFSGLFHVKKNSMMKYVLILLLPVLFILLVVQYIFMAYGSTIILGATGVRLWPKINDGAMLVIQISAYFCLLAVLFAYQKLSDAFVLQMKNALLEQQVHTQKDYMQELQSRYEQTRAFRHDVNNHWAVLKGLLQAKEHEKAFTYLNKLKTVSDTLSFPCQTGSVIVDTLLTNKLGLAQQKGVQVDCRVKLPAEAAIDEMDLCIVFSNAVDNAIKACSLMQGAHPYLIVTAFQKGNFFMIEVKNSRTEEREFKKGSGIGLNSIRAIAEKYHGTVSIESAPDFFQLNVLFIIPQPPQSI